MKLSVIVTAYNNESTLSECLDSLLSQSLEPDEYEVVVVSDGSSDNTDSIAQSYTHLNPSVRFIQQENMGVGKARNTGAEASRNEIILFTQADIIAHKELLKQHMKFHFSHPRKEFALVGYTTWHPDMEVTPFMRWLEHGGPQFDYDRVKTEQDRLGKTDFLTFYTTNLSIKKEFFTENNGFDLDFKGSGGITAYEDTELGYRLEKHGMQLFYESRAMAYHKHVKNLLNVINRRYYEGIIAHRLLQKHPKIKLGPRFNDYQLFWLSVWLINPVICFPLVFIATYIQNVVYFPILYKIVARAYYNLGFLVGYIKYA